MSAPFRVIKTLERKLEQSRVQLADLEALAHSNAQKIADEQAWQAELAQAIDALHSMDDEP